MAECAILVAMAAKLTHNKKQKLVTIGVDEVGRGSLAGPVCVAAVAWKSCSPAKGLADSKKLTAKQRRQMALVIKNEALAIGIGWVDAPEIDRVGVNFALKKAALIALEQIKTVTDCQIIVDGRDKLLGDVPAEYIVKADGKIPAVMAASIIAKVARDSYMCALSKVHPKYGFDSHAGYGTARHMAAIAEFGACQLHRMSYSPLKETA